MRAAVTICFALLVLALVGQPVSADLPLRWAEIERSDDAVHDGFGTAVAIFGNLALVGSPGDDGAASEAGAAHLFARTGRGWRTVQVLVPEDPAGSPAFGAAAALGRHVLAIGAPGRYASGASDGSVEIYRRAGRAWVADAVLTGSDAVSGAHFGASLALQGRTLVVGAPGTTVSPGVVGAVYVFEQIAGVWQETAKLTSPVRDTNGRFGASVALDRHTLVVGAPGESHVQDGGDTGTAYVYRREGAGFTAPQILRGSDDRSQVFGAAVGVSGRRIAVGAPAVGSGISAGESGVYVFGLEGGDWVLEERLRPTTVAAADRFGAPLVLAGRLLFVAAPHTAVPGDLPHTTIGRGLVYGFELRPGAWHRPALLRPPGGANFFGKALAVAPGGLMGGAPDPDPARAAAYVLQPDRRWRGRMK